MFAAWDSGLEFEPPRQPGHLRRYARDPHTRLDAGGLLSTSSRTRSLTKLRTAMKRGMPVILYCAQARNTCRQLETLTSTASQTSSCANITSTRQTHDAPVDVILSILSRFLTSFSTMAYPIKHTWKESRSTNYVSSFNCVPNCLLCDDR